MLWDSGYIYIYGYDNGSGLLGLTPNTGVPHACALRHQAAISLRLGGIEIYKYNPFTTIVMCHTSLASLVR